MTRTELKKDILAQYPGLVRLNTKMTASVIGKHPNHVRGYMKGYLSEKLGTERFYFISDIAEAMVEKSSYYRK